MKNIKLELTPEMALLAECALRDAANTAQERVDNGDTDDVGNQIGQVRWLARYFEAKRRDA